MEEVCSFLGSVTTTHTIYCMFAMNIQWNPSIADTIETQHFARYSEVSLTQGLPVYFR